MVQAITEAEGIHKEWYAQAKEQTLESLPEFLRHLTEDYRHDYGTICHAVAAGALAGAWAVERSPSGGITGFQAGAIMWQFIAEWQGFQGKPLRLVQYENMLYPQYADSFDKTISEETWKWLQEKARELLAENKGAHGAVSRHWKEIAAGRVPFGYGVKDD